MKLKLKLNLKLKLKLSSEPFSERIESQNII